MQILPLYPETPRLPVEIELPRELDHTCELCSLHKNVRSVCLRAEGQPGGLLIVSDYPGKAEDRANRPFVGRTGNYLRSQLKKHWDGPVAFDNALRCAPGKTDIPKKAVASCRGYLSQTIREAAPKRILAMGATSFASLLGRSPPPFSVRRGYAFLSDGTPVFLLMNPAAALRNRFVRKWFESDLEWALRAEPKPKWNGMAYVIDSEADALDAERELTNSGWFAYDTETAGLMFDPSFELLCVAAGAPGSDHVWVWDKAALNNGMTLRSLVRLLKDPSVGKGGWNLKYDLLSVWCGLKVKVVGIHGDGMMQRKLLFSDAEGKLATNAELVGLGGHKEEADAEVRAACETIQKTRRDAKKGLQLLPGFGNTTTVNALEHPHVEPKRFAYGEISREVLLRYCGRDAFTTADANDLLDEQIDEVPPIRRIWHQVARPAIPALAQVEIWGMAVERDSIDRLGMYISGELNTVRGRFTNYGKFNPDSNVQVSRLLYEDLGLPCKKKTKKGGQSVDHEALKAIRTQHPIVQDLLHYRGLAKMKVAFVDGLRGHIRPDGRVHPNLRPQGTRSGRLSCVRRGTLVEIVRDVSEYPKGIPIEDVRTGDLAYCYLPDGELAIRKVLKAWRTGVRELVRVHWRGTGRRHRGYIDLTPEHRVRLTSKEWKAAGDLQAGDRVVALSRGYTNGYARIYPTGASMMREHRFIFEQLHGWLPEHVHHENTNKLDNRAANLIGKTASDHLSDHGKDTSPKLRAFRSQKLHQQWATGSVVPLHGKCNGRWLGLTQTEVENALRANAWSITKAARANGWDFNTFKRYVIRVGFDLTELKQRNRALRRLGGNHEILRVERLVEIDDVYDLTIEDAACFIAGELCVHNCTDPNIQQIPRADTKLGRMLKDCFVAPPGRQLIQLDYGQLELRIAAELSGDKVMQQIFRDGVDFHLRTAELISKLAWGIEPHQVEDRHRTMAKTVNFAVLFGMSPRTLAKKLGCPVRDAERIVNALYSQFTTLKRWIDEQLANARQTGETWTYWDGEPARRRALWKIADNDGEVRSRAEHSAWNTPIQGSASEFCLASLVRVVNWIVDNDIDAKLVMAVHDSLILEALIEQTHEIAYTVKDIMTTWPTRGIDLEVDIKVGPAWGSLEKLAA